jgi:outer membrane receptor protein involved in Fe transport
VRIPTIELGEVIDNNEALVFDLAASRKLGEHLFVYSNVGSSYRSPNVDDLGTLGIVDFRFELPQYGLSPEYSLNKELGVKWKSNRAMATLSGYHNRLTGLITRVKSPSDSLQGYPVYWKQNVGESEIWGAEWDFQLLIGKKSQVKAGAFFTVGDNLTAHEPMRRIPPAMFNVEWIFRPNKQWQIGLVMYGAKSQQRLAKGDIQDNRIGPQGTAGYVTGDVRCRYQKKGMYMDVALTNVGNQLYKTHGSGVFMPGRALQFVLGF